MVNFILIRHGQTERNLQKRIQGQSDSPLSSLGKYQSRMLAARLADHFRPHVLVSSDLGRAVATAEIIAMKTGLTAIRDERFRELSFGEAEGKTWEIINKDFFEISQAWRDHVPHARFPRGESRAEGVERCMEGLLDLACAYPQRSIAVVTHGGILASLAAKILQIPCGVRPKLSIENTSLNMLRYKSGRWKFCSWGDLAHLEA